MIRFMTLESPQKMLQARFYYYSIYIIFGFLAVGVGLLSRLLLEESALFDSDLAVILMIQEVLPSAFVGLMLAGIFAATMSTADSFSVELRCYHYTQFVTKPSLNFVWIRGCVVLMTAIALLLAFTSEDTVFNIVVMSWSALGSAFVPLIIVLCLGWNPSQKVSICAILCGIAAALLWRYSGASVTIYEGLIGILAGLWVYGIWQGLHAHSLV